ncbi:uncharacterized protein EV420DRAFT_1649273 [Desarmillaria tabescens]|uniref:Aminoglycoside phosphotransferase domain-containing protein n=1 Tax=Armillaria tabescens TaxID=1929756 RepID=A0AA39JJH6_ARMTA|nr:uncharacterized protein EV420DRAFT_1649273 [Desarmillaria tabescens]KAK0443337.1 hypothetical protein EV420DRAFT_1649273 [Desarmillaria tabescens]
MSVSDEDWSPSSSWDKCAVRLSPDVVGKLVTCSETGWSPEAQAQELVRLQTNIPWSQPSGKCSPWMTWAPFPPNTTSFNSSTQAKEKATWPGGVALAWPSQKEAGTLVFSHVDLAMRNLVVGDDGQLWLIDFGEARFYPPWFEFVNMLGDQIIAARGKECDAIWRAADTFHM